MPADQTTRAGLLAMIKSDIRAKADLWQVLNSSSPSSGKFGRRTHQWQFQGWPCIVSVAAASDMHDLRGRVPDL